MKKYRESSVSGLLPIIFTLGLAAYFMIIIIKYPLVGIEVREENHQWIVESIYEHGWASGQKIEKGDLLELVNEEKPKNHSTVFLFNKVEMAKSITILNKDLETQKFKISYSNIENQYITYLLLPLLFCITTILLSVFLYRSKQDDQSAIILIYFLLSIGLSYLSASGSTRGDIIGKFTTTVTLSGSLILFLHFIKSYLEKFNLTFIASKSLMIFYVINSLVLLIEICSLVLYPLSIYIRMIKLLLFLLLIIYLFLHLGIFYFKHKNSEGHVVLKILLFTLFLAFGPFFLFYAVPSVFWGSELISAEIVATFLIIIPIALVYLLLTEKLFDIEFLFNRLRYYSLLSIPFAVLIIIFLYFILDVQLDFRSTIILFFLLYLGTTLFLYVKEYLDYKLRHHLFSQKGDFENSLYTFFQKAKRETKVDSLVTNLKSEIKGVLKVKEVLNIELFLEKDKKTWSIENSHHYLHPFVEDLEKVRWDQYQIGALVEILDRFAIVLGGDHDTKNIILFGMKKSQVNLNIQERIWLETLAYFSSILLENFQLIEELFEKIENYKEKLETGRNGYPLWLSRLMFTLSEKERTNLSIDLHDSVLQDQLQLLREVEKISEKVSDSSVKNDLFELKEGMLDNIHLVRETCNELRPPFLNELGVIQSIQNLIDQTKLRCNFNLLSDMDPSIQGLDQDVELALYRVVQELLNNAMKHSLASEVKVSLQKNNQMLSLTYSDNGKGIDMDKLNNSFQTMGIFGMKERIKSIGGTIQVHAAPGEGMHVHMEVKEEGDRGHD